jgi:hypothetical protein
MPDSKRAVVDNLVTQFSNPLHCFRELVQNSIDAGSATVEIWTEFIDQEGHEGTIALHVDDYGEGMDEQIIDQEFTRLFASSKEKDLTKIGQFGIGFVSTFALEPEAIMVETGRSGEYWEVLFHADRSFTKTELDVPVEGTQITIFLRGDVHRYRQMVGDIEQTLRRWCAHSDTRVTFEDRSPPHDATAEPSTINEPFDVEGDCTTTVEHEGTKIVAAYSTDPMYGFYNRGLTLELTDTGDEVLGERAERYAHIAFKIKSRYLEHTLSRETVMRDANFEKAMDLLGDAVEGPLLDNLLDHIEQLATKSQWSYEQFARYGRLLDHLSREPTPLIVEARDRRLLRTVDGRAISLETALDTWQRDGRLLIDTEPTELTERLRTEGIPVILGGDPTVSGDHLEAIPELITDFVYHAHESSLLHRFRRFAFSADLRSEAESAIASPGEVYLPVVVDDEMPDHLTALVDDVHELLDSVDAGYDTIHTCTVGSSANSDPPLFVTGRQLGATMSRPPAHIDADRRSVAAINREHPQCRETADLYARSPGLATYCLAKSMLLSAERSPTLDAKLFNRATDSD